MSNWYLKKSDSFKRALDNPEKDFSALNTSSETSSIEGSEKFTTIKSPNLEENGDLEFDSFDIEQQSLNHLHSPVRHHSTDSGHISSQSRSILNDFTHDAVPLSVFYKKHHSVDKTHSNTRPTLEQLHKGVGLENAKKRHWVRELNVEYVFLLFGSYKYGYINCPPKLREL